MDRVVTATEANQRFSELLREAAAGATITITQRGRPVVDMSPAKTIKRPTRAQLDALFARMDALPGVVAGSWTRDDLYDRQRD